MGDHGAASRDRGKEEDKCKRQSEMKAGESGLKAASF